MVNSSSQGECSHEVVSLRAHLKRNRNTTGNICTDSVTLWERVWMSCLPNLLQTYSVVLATACRTMLQTRYVRQPLSLNHAKCEHPGLSSHVSAHLAMLSVSEASRDGQLGPPSLRWPISAHNSSLATNWYPDAQMSAEITKIALMPCMHVSNEGWVVD